MQYMVLIQVVNILPADHIDLFVPFPVQRSKQRELLLLLTCTPLTWLNRTELLEGSEAAAGPALPRMIPLKATAWVLGPKMELPVPEDVLPPI